MIIKDIVMEDFINYKKPSMFIITSTCTFKCEKECGKKICQNSSIVKQDNKDISNDKIVSYFLLDPITEAIVFGGLEPFDQFEDVLDIIDRLRHSSDADVVIYTGYKEEELEDDIAKLKKYNNIIVKFGRFVPDQEARFDEVLGVNLASYNQYAKYISWE